MADEVPAKNDLKDPVVERSLSWPLAIVALLLLLSTAWAVYDEFVGRRPWKQYQAAFVPAYSQFLQSVEEEQRRKQTVLEADPEYQALKAEYAEVHDSLAPEREELNREIVLVTSRTEAVTNTLRAARSYTAATVYQIETAASENARERLRAGLDEYHQGPFEVELPDGEGGNSTATYDYGQLLDTFNELKDQKSELRRKQGQLVQEEAQKKKAMDTYLARYLDGPTSETVQGLRLGLARFNKGITAHQIHVEEAGLVDRCEVCHLAIRSSVPTAAEAIRQAAPDLSEEMANAFASHPRIELTAGELLDVHSPDSVGCTSCHGGNGYALTSVDQAHGTYKHWLWPLHDSENTEGGCLQCHQGALHLEGAPTLNRGRYLFQRLGCWGCHPRDGYDAEIAALSDIARDERHVQSERLRLSKELDAAYESDDFAVDPDVIKQKLSQLDADSDQLMIRRAGYERARKKPAPSLKEVGAKLKKEWLPVWIRDPRSFRPTTRMPQFDFTEDQLRAISAFVWQSADAKQVSRHEPGDPERGKIAFETRGCRACHGINEEPRFAADLARLDEKINFDYLVEWIHDPSEGAIMPSLRLNLQETRDVASYLTSQQSEIEYESAEYLTDESLVEEGYLLVKHFGCFGCHDIAGTEDLGKIATDLTQEGSKPIERLDFGLLTHEAHREGWYDHKGFFDRKLSDPQRFDEGKLRLDWHDKLKMPDFGLADKPEDRTSLMTFLLGSVDSRLPESFHHEPSGWAKDIEEGWWVVVKYNCVGCHQMVPGQTPDVWTFAQYQGEGRADAPPSLVGAGARIDENWVTHFLRNPALDETKLDRNGARMYLDIRMPTYQLSEEEIGKLTRFLAALSRQTLPSSIERLEPLSDDELADARALFQVGKCLSCHVTSDDPATFTSATKAPSYLVGAARLKASWMRHWLRDPDKIMPGTVMPAFFKEIDGRWRATVLAEDQLRVKDADQVELMVRYQKFFDEAEANYLLSLEGSEAENTTEEQ